MAAAFGTAVIGLLRGAVSTHAPPPKRFCGGLQTVVASAVAQWQSSQLGSQPTRAYETLSQPHDLTEVMRDPKSKSRRAYRHAEQRKLGEQAERFRLLFPGNAKGTKYGWLQAFCDETQGAHCPKHQRKVYIDKVRSAMQTRAAGRPSTGTSKRCALENMTSCKRKSPRYRQRGDGGGRHRLCAELDDETWHWYVDRLAASKTRVSTEEMLKTASYYVHVLRERHQDRIERGEIDPRLPANLPKINLDWLRRWRKRFNVSAKTVTLRYKISRSVFKNRLKVYWLNCIRVRALWRKLKGDTKADLKFICFDQTPKWFNSILNEKTNARKGCRRRVTITENVSASRERFTVNTTCRSWDDGAIPKIGVLFKGSPAQLQTLQDSTTIPEGVLLQTAPFGSYNTAEVVKFLTWALDEHKGEEGLAVCLDWFAAHLHQDVDAICDELGIAVIRIGGGLTANIQTNDTHAHKPYNGHYRSLEMTEATEEGLVRPNRLPGKSKNTVMNRSATAWSLVDHSKCAHGFKHNGVTNALDGSEDCDISSDNFAFWEELEMPKLREIAIAEVDEAVDRGELTDFMTDYRSVLEEYDDHEPIRVGFEDPFFHFADEENAHMCVECASDDEDDEPVGEGWVAAPSLAVGINTGLTANNAGQLGEGSVSSGAAHDTDLVVQEGLPANHEGQLGEGSASSGAAHDADLVVHERLPANHEELVADIDAEYSQAKFDAVRESIRLLEEAGCDDAATHMAMELRLMLRKRKTSHSATTHSLLIIIRQVYLFCTAVRGVPPYVCERVIICASCAWLRLGCN